MAGPQDDPIAAEWLIFRDLTTAGRSAEAYTLADEIIAGTVDPLRVGQALIEKLVALLNLGQADDRRATAAILDAIGAALAQAPRHPRLTGEYHVLSGVVAHENGSLGTAANHLVRAERVLRRMSELSVAAADTWHDLSSAYSAMGFHAKALDAMRQGRQLCVRANITEAICACLETQVRAAVAADHQGCTDIAVRDLEAAVRFGRASAADLNAMDTGFLAYAAARLCVLGVPTEAIAPPDPGEDPSLIHAGQLRAVCDALSGGDPDRALQLLDDVSGPIDVFGAAETHRLRSIVESARGDHAAALAAERLAMRLTTTPEREVRSRYIGSVGVTLDQERLRKMAARHADAALSDPLTGLPNRRRLEAFIAALAARRVPAVIGLLDLDGFKAVNDTHGHPTGDLVLQRVAGILARNMRPDDLLARYGGDEFVVVLPSTTVEQAYQIGRRMTAAVDAHDWQALARSTPVSISAGWAALEDDLAAALRVADQELYRNKRSRSSL
ncbi:GGDEF domain-containing protein [Hamadaea tsunoensis]|uniref:GGDEF domain-containing protein n=1 Tax=Hamadaea tsunoensis TaxID=53368 RepID=UPI000423D6D0|nr:GGDEF domain-containing protein [Hamadaea tsunoensis]